MPALIVLGLRRGRDWGGRLTACLTAVPPAGEEGSRNAWTEAIVGTDWETYRREGPGVSAFALEDGVVYHAYSAYERGLDAVWGMYQWLDRAPLGRNATGHWWRRHDEYDAP